jgi:hypothetical protein
MTKPPKELLLEHERFELKPKSGGGLLSYEVWGYEEEGVIVVTRYNLAYINHSICQVDNGRVLGYDNAHDYHHRHCMGDVQPVEFSSYEVTVERFQQEWLEIVRMWSVISSPFGSSDLGALRCYKSLMWHGHTARFAPSIASQL